MNLDTQIFFACKQGHSDQEYEDAFAASDRRIAIADGASESAFAGEWAQILTQQFIQDEEAFDHFESWIRQPRATWLQQVQRDDLPWFLQEKVQQGAFATFLGWEMFPLDQEWAYAALAVGDCNLFHIRGDTLLATFPQQHSSEFGSQPDLVSSRSTRKWNITRTSGELQPGDRFWFCTDALACWFLAQIEAQKKPWNMLAKVDSNSTFSQGIQRLREQNAIKNDDTTAMCITLSDE